MTRARKSPARCRHAPGWILVAPLLAGLAGCDAASGPPGPDGAPEGPIIFEDVTERAGITFSHFNSRRASVLPEDMGSGVAWGDVDGDRAEDLYLVNYAGPLLASRAEIRSRPGNRLYRNRGDGTFEDVTERWGLVRSARDFGALFGDLDNDGDADLLVTGMDGCALYRNDGNHFTDVSETSGVAAVRGMAMGAAFGDYDLDGDLDIYIPCYVSFPTEKARHRRLVGGRPEPWTTPASYPAQPNYLLRNDGGLRFSDVTSQAGVRNPKGRSMQAVFADLNGDLLPEIFVGNDQSIDVLYRNNGDGTFTNVSLEAGTWDPRASMGIGVGDIDFDGRPDLHLTHYVQEAPALYRNLSGDVADAEGRPRLLFADVAEKTWILRSWEGSLVGWATGLHDLDNDQDVDLFAAHGSTIEDELTEEVFVDPRLLPQRAMLLANDGRGRFHDVAAAAGSFFREHVVARGGAFADFDQDGRLDIALNLHNARARLLRNVSPPAYHWLRVRLVGRRNNRDGVGAALSLTVGDRTLHRQVLAGSSYLAGDSLVIHFGLGAHAHPERLEIRWPVGGRRQVIERPRPDRTLTVTEAP